MCGLLAASGEIDPRYIRALGILNEDRGKDSAGIGWWEKGAPSYLKIADRPLTAWTIALSSAVDEAAASGVVVGHTRFATTGAVNSENAHPFIDQNIVFAHNGVIHNHAEFGKYTVDSQALIHGIKARSFAKFKGTIALVWIEDGRLHVYRSGNPLWRGNLGKAVYMASQRSFLDAIGAHKVQELAEDHLYEFEGRKVKSSLKIGGTAPQVYTTTYPARYSYDRDWEEEIPKSGTAGFSPDVWDEQERMIKSGGTGLRCECGHWASAHIKRVTTTPACYDHEKTGKVDCLCLAFRLPKGKVTVPYCQCGHPYSWHWKDVGCSMCLDACPRFAFAKRDKPYDIDKEAMCQCEHKAEYHAFTSGNGKCRMVGCNCAKYAKLTASI